MAIHIGTSGWRYKEWGKKFYPEGTKQDEFLPFYASKFDTVEINASFYHLPGPSAFEHWQKVTPPKFLFAVKMSRYITHILRLADSKEAVGNFLKNAEYLGPKLGPMLIQLPPNFKIDLPKLEAFLKDLKAAQNKQRRGKPKLRFALEVRHKSWLTPEAQKPFMALLKKFKVALVFGHSSKYPYPENEPVTADFIYLRFHGPKQFAGSLYGKKLEAWAPKIKRWSKRGLDVFAYFNNDMQAYAIKDVIRLKTILFGES